MLKKYCLVAVLVHPSHGDSLRLYVQGVSRPRFNAPDQFVRKGVAAA